MAMARALKKIETRRKQDALAALKRESCLSGYKQARGRAEDMLSKLQQLVMSFDLEADRLAEGIIQSTLMEAESSDLNLNFVPRI
mmetsp:Transcript_50394/g.108608  ORF Transcript_50394/g.108608 Transcript_50394/m.108608 type:complete len:85 (-) Transcript_50394:80-334(-)